MNSSLNFLTKYIVMITLSVYLILVPTFADIIGCDDYGIVCLSDDLEVYTNEFRSLDLDFDGKYELYYFDINGRLKTDAYIDNYYLNSKGQQTTASKTTILDITPESVKTYQIDNLDYYYISKVKTKFNETFDVQEETEEKLKCRVSIDIPEIVGENKSIVDNVNKVLLNRGLELLKLYANIEIYKRDTNKFSISIDKYVKENIQLLNFVPNLDQKFYFNFTVKINLQDKTDITKYIGLCVDGDKCFITNTNYSSLNDKIYSEKESNDAYKNTNTNIYSSRYKSYIEELKEKYEEALIQYLDEADDYISTYEDKCEDKKQVIYAIEKYIKNIDAVYNSYTNKAKKSYQSDKIDENTYKFICDDFKEKMEHYKMVLDKNLQVTINALKE